MTSKNNPIIESGTATMKRIVAIDILRGFALLGIFVMNIMTFSMPIAAYFNPTVFGGDDLFNRLTYAIVHILADQKFMALFSILFGASVMLLTDSLQRKDQKVARFYYTRNVWLFIFGLLHFIFIWYGDILAVYALCSFILFFLRQMAPKWQLSLGLIIFCLPAIGYVAAGNAVNNMSVSDIAALDVFWSPSEAEIADEIALYRGDYASQIAGRMALTETAGSSSKLLYDTIVIFESFGRAFGMMLVGMALYSMGIVTAQKNGRFYKRMLMGFPIGFILAALGLWWNNSADWSIDQSMFFGRLFNLFATPFIAGGYIALIMLWSSTTLWQPLQQRLAATGRIALTNYIMQSILGTFIFYGIGLGLFGSFNRVMLLPVIIAVWLLQLWLSPLWLRRFRYGPLEWMWRSLSNWKIQPLRHSVY